MARIPWVICRRMMTQQFRNPSSAQENNWPSTDSGMPGGDWQLQPMSIGEYAAYERATGAVIAEAGGVFWRRVRPFFYRPMQPFLPLELNSVQPPRPARWGGWQCVVTDSARANSAMAFLMFRNAENYCLDELEKKRRWEVRTAKRFFSVRLLACAEELYPAHEVFVEFQRRTGYRYRSDRVNPQRFYQWAQEVFRHPKVKVLGAFTGPCLQAVGIVHRVGDTMNFSTFFAASEALRRHVASLMLHVVRVLAAEPPSVHRVFAGMKKWGTDASVDEFYLQRGCELKVLPAFYHVNPLVCCLLRLLRPDQWRRLTSPAFGGASSEEAPPPRIIQNSLD